MSTWRLWRMLRHPPLDHPLYRRGVTSYSLSPALRHRLWLSVLFIMFVSGCGGIFFPGLQWLLPFTLLMVVPILLLVYIVGTGTFFGVFWAATIASRIAVERQRGTFDLLCVSPSGAFGVCRVMASARLDREQLLHNLYAQKNTLAMAAAVVVFFFAVFLTNDSDFYGGVLAILTYGLIVIAAFYADFIQSVVIAVMIGLLTPTRTTDPFDARLWAVGGFLFAQVSVYTLTWLIGFQVLPGFYDSAGISGVVADLSLSALRLLIFCGLREIIIIALWLALAEALNVDRSTAIRLTGLPEHLAPFTSRLSPR
jgi:hypothetical protein